MNIPPAARAAARDLLDFIDASPSPWHAVATAVKRLADAGYAALDETDRWSLQPGGRYYVVRGGASLIAFVMGSQPLLETGLRIVGAHTDSPAFRLKPRPLLTGDGLARLGVEVYGSPILASFTDRDLSLAGRVVIQNKSVTETRLVRFTRPMLRLPNLAIHMNREVNEQGLKLHRQTELPLLFAQLSLLGAIDEHSADARLRGLLASAALAEACDIQSWELNIHDAQPGTLWGANEEFIASRQLDNLASSCAALSALIATPKPAATCMVALFDHEEVGSESATGAAGSLLIDVLARIAAQARLDTEDQLRTRARSLFISADMSHAYQPNFPAAYEPNHKVSVNAGPVIKTNVNQRYATNAETAAYFMRCCKAANVPFQQYTHRSDLGCGSTIGPLVAARLGMATVDVGSPMWAMHSARESAGVLDHTWMISALQAVYAH